MSNRLLSYSRGQVTGQYSALLGMESCDKTNHRTLLCTQWIGPCASIHCDQTVKFFGAIPAFIGQFIQWKHRVDRCYTGYESRRCCLLPSKKNLPPSIV